MLGNGQQLNTTISFSKQQYITVNYPKPTTVKNKTIIINNLPTPINHKITTINIIKLTITLIININHKTKPTYINNNCTI